MTYFYSFEYLDCSRVTSFKDELRYMSVLYAMTSVLIALSLLRPFSKKPTIVQKFLPLLPLLKLLYVVLNLMYWNSCPWYPMNESANFIRSFKVTMATFFQTLFSLAFVSMTMGFGISRSQLDNNDLKKVMIATATQYFIDSLYSIGSYVTILKPLVIILLNCFSALMIGFILYQTK